jgi:hypothetical protein
LYQAVKNSAALKPKSEFETTAQFEERKKTFASAPIGAKITPADALAFVVHGDSQLYAPNFKYDADSQTLTFTLSASPRELFSEPNSPTIDTLLVRTVVVSSGSYMASNAFGAKVKVDKIFSQEYGVGISENNWLFHTTEEYTREFQHLFSTSPEQAKAMKENGRVLFVCHLTEPWFHSTAHGHEAKIDEPYETTVGDNYIEVVPDQVWIFNEKTGEILAKLSEEAVANGRDEQLKIKLKQTPLLLEVSSARSFLYRITTDDKPEQLDHFSGKNKVFTAQHKITFKLEYPDSLSDLSFTLNGKPYTPNWTKDSNKIGSHEFIKSATVVITVP